MALPPEAISASLFICEKALFEEDRVVSAIRLVDIFYVNERPAHLPEKIQPAVEAVAILMVKCKPEDPKEFEISTKLITPDGTEHEVGKKHRVNTASKVSGVPGGMTVRIHLSVAISGYGTYYLCALLDGEEVSRVPFSILLRPQKQQKGPKQEADKQASPNKPNQPQD
jgi:hypothetical protein